MSLPEKTVFISYRRANASWAIAICQNLTQHGFDVFVDLTGIASGDFERITIANIRARAHFVVLLTPSALERCVEHGDWLRREIETALDNRRNIVPLMLEGFSFETPSIGARLTGKLALLKRYNALRVPADYFHAAMDRMRNEYLRVSLHAVLHPLPPSVEQTVEQLRAAVQTKARVTTTQLSAQEWYEEAFKTTMPKEKIRLVSEALRLDPSFAEAYLLRGSTFVLTGDLDAAIADFDRTLESNRDAVGAYYFRGTAHRLKGDWARAMSDYDRLLEVAPDSAEARFAQEATQSNIFAQAYVGRALVRMNVKNKDRDGAMADLNRALGLKPDHAEAFCHRGVVRYEKGDHEGARADWGRALQLQPDHSTARRFMQTLGK